MITAQQQEARDAVEQHGSQRAAARALGIDAKSLRSRLERAARWEEAPQGQREAILHSGLDIGIAKAGWRKVKNADGTSDSVYWRSPDNDESEPEDLAERIADKMNKIRPAPAIKRPAQTSSKFRNFLPLFDVHLSMKIGDYGTAAAVDRLRQGSADLIARMPATECLIVVNGGDFTHQNDNSNLTPQSKHPLPVDTDYCDTTDAAVEVTAGIIDEGLTRNDTVLYKPLRGNHDPVTALILRAALKQRYRNNERVIIDTDGIDFFVHEWAGNFIAAHHGDIRKKPADLVLGFANKYAQAWGRTVYRDLYTGHLHHLKVLDETGMSLNQVRAVCPADRHSIENLYQSHSEMIGVIYREGGGVYDRMIHGFPLLEHEIA